MSEVVAVQPGLPDWFYGRLGTCPVPDAMVPVVTNLFAKKASVVTLDDLESYGVEGWSPSEMAQVLRRKDWLFPLRCQGAWQFYGYSVSLRTPGFAELRARLRVRPNTPACIGGRSVAQAHSWLRRPTGRTVGMPPRVKAPSCFQDYTVCRWEPQIPLDEIEGLPVWKPETLLVFMGARPGSFPWSDIAEWLWEGCEPLEEDLLLNELEGRPRATWIKTAYILDAGERPNLSDTLVKLCPSNAKGPYLFADRTYRYGALKRTPVWSAKYEVVDYIFPRWWIAKWR